MEKILLSHPTGNQNLRAVISSFKEAGILTSYSTTLAFDPDSSLVKLFPDKVKKEFLRRSYPVDFDLIHTRPLLELSRNILPRLGFKGAVAHETGFASVDKVYHDLDSATAAYLKKLNRSKSVTSVYAYEDGALETFKAARKMGLTNIYDLPIGYWRAARRLLKTSQERWPEWAATLTGFRDSEQKLARKDEELRLADKIFVASSFTAKTLQDFPGALPNIQVIPYGFPEVIRERSYANPANKPLKLLFVGGLSLRKGIADLFAAVKNIGAAVDLTVVGRKTNADCAALDAALKENKWIPSLPHHEILQLMREHDVLIFPSLFEGFGLVITEAMSQGTPVITTDRTAGPDLITHGLNGWLIEAESTSAIQTQIEELISKPELIAAAGREAMATARLRPWKKYGQELSEAIMST
ncbi:glycosyltransferase family 4 protein [Pedobacter hartonius]|uniref:Glycosyl transferases group 1 n=1 Tax=Pedobacter hartonius TaxID=425514 RepID=A0A1H4FNV0_9SPHI|nr:glycosyltransferase family 4 protein [Pedobacter hartonius]SEA98821.1 Glycosyl transferases group 1 [Pedobacter hartonius]